MWGGWGGWEGGCFIGCNLFFDYIKTLRDSDVRLYSGSPCFPPALLYPRPSSPICLLLVFSYLLYCLSLKIPTALPFLHKKSLAMHVALPLGFCNCTAEITRCPCLEPLLALFNSCTDPAVWVSQHGASHLLLMGTGLFQTLCYRK